MQHAMSAAIAFFVMVTGFDFLLFLPPPERSLRMRLPVLSDLALPPLQLAEAPAALNPSRGSR